MDDGRMQNSIHLSIHDVIFDIYNIRFVFTSPNGSIPFHHFVNKWFEDGTWKIAQSA